MGASDAQAMSIRRVAREGWRVGRAVRDGWRGLRDVFRRCAGAPPLLSGEKSQQTRSKFTGHQTRNRRLPSSFGVVWCKFIKCHFGG